MMTSSGRAANKDPRDWALKCVGINFATISLSLCLCIGAMGQSGMACTWTVPQDYANLSVYTHTSLFLTQQVRA